jgi:NADH dehydrogenase FAD-containing subunit
MTKTIVILGANFSGTILAHKLLKHTLPKSPDLKVIIVTESTHLYFNPVAVRGIIPDKIPDTSLFQPIQPGYAKYPKDSYRIIIGTAEKVIPKKNTVEIKTSSGPDSVTYDYLVVATGSKAGADNPLKLITTYEATLKSLHEWQEKIAAAQSIVVGGGGPSGVEIAGELDHAYGTNKPITLILGGPRPLPTLMESVGNAAEAQLKSLNVKIIRNAKVVSASEKNGKTEVVLDTDEKIVTSLYIPTVGLTKSTSFLPAALLDPSNNGVIVDHRFLAKGTTNIYAIGDASALQSAQVTNAEWQATHLANNLHAEFTSQPASVKDYKPQSWQMMVVAVGPDGGTGQLFWFRFWSWLVWLGKSKTLGVEKVAGFAAGEKFLMGGA